MNETRQRFLYRVCGFGDHTEWKIVEFVEELDDVQVCSWCGVVSAKAVLLSCLHLICDECRTIAYKAAVPVCLIDEQTLSSEVKCPMKYALKLKKVRCVYVDSGCDYTGCLEYLNSHLHQDCAFYLSECSKCEEAIVFKDLVGHHKACRGLAGVFVSAVDGQPLLDDIENARRELEKALAMTHHEVRDTVGLLADQLETLRSQLTSSEGRADKVT